MGRCRQVKYLRCEISSDGEVKRLFLVGVRRYIQITVGEGLAPPAVSPSSVGADSISARRRLSDRLPPGWEQGAVALPQRPAPQGCLKEKAQSKEDISVPTEENRGKHLIKGKSLLSYPPAPSPASRSPSLPEGGRIKVKSEK